MPKVGCIKELKFICVRPAEAKHACDYFEARTGPESRLVPCKHMTLFRECRNRQAQAHLLYPLNEVGDAGVHQ